MQDFIFNILKWLSGLLETSNKTIFTVLALVVGVLAYTISQGSILGLIPISPALEPWAAMLTAFAAYLSQHNPTPPASK